MGKLVAASILSADFSRLGQDISEAEEAGVDWLHFDVMDGAFVPNISFGIPVLESVRKFTDVPLDVHLMIESPQKYLQAFADAGADYLTVHAEACEDLPACIRQIRELGVKAGVSVNPGTSLDCVKEIMSGLDLFLVMGVEPGFGGQKFDEKVLGKISSARKIIDDAGADTLLEVDGGVNLETASKISKAGAEVFVAGSYIFKNPAGKAKAVSDLRQHI